MQADTIDRRNATQSQEAQNVVAQSGFKMSLKLSQAGEIEPLALYTPEEVARLLVLGRNTVFGLLARGEIASIKVGRLRRITTTALANYIARLEAQAALAEEQARGA